MNLASETGQNEVTLLNALNASLFSIKICPQEGVIAPDSNQLPLQVLKLKILIV